MATLQNLIILLICCVALCGLVKAARLLANKLTIKKELEDYGYIDKDGRAVADAAGQAIREDAKQIGQ